MGRGKPRLGAQFDVVARGGIVHLARAGMRPSRIVQLVKKTSGKLGKIDVVRKTIRNTMTRRESGADSESLALEHLANFLKRKTIEL